MVEVETGRQGWEEGMIKVMGLRRGMERIGDINQKEVVGREKTEGKTESIRKRKEKE